MVYRIPVYQPSLRGKERDYVVQCLESTWISSKGEFIPKFENAFAEFTGVRHATGVTNGTTALHLALLALGIGPGDEVIVPTFTYVASVNTITYTGAKPMFVDSTMDTWQMDPEDVGRKITPQTRAIMAVHLYGHPCDMEALAAIARMKGLFLIEDCAEAFGSMYNGRHVGTFGDIAAFSFFGNKTITTGEGGMVVTNDDTLHYRAVHFKGQGLARDREYWHDVIGYNYRMTNICAAIGLAQLERAKEILDAKRRIAAVYNEKLAGLPLVPQYERGNVLHSYWMYSVLAEDSKSRDSLRNHLAVAGVETRPTFYPVHTMPMYASKYDRHPVAEALGWRGINLPSWPDLSEEYLEYIVHEIRDYYGKLSASTP